MAKMILSSVNRVDGGTVTAGSQAAALPVTNVQDPIVQVPWQTAGTTTSWVQVDFGAAYPIDAIGMFGADLTGTDTWRIRLSALTAGAGELLDTGAVATGIVTGYGQAVHTLAAPVTARYLRIDIAAPSRATQGYFRIGRLWAGPALRPEINISYGFAEEWRDYGVNARAPYSGARYAEDRYKARALAFAFEAIRATEVQAFRELSRVAGTTAQILTVIDPDAADINERALLGHLEQASPITRPGFDIFAKTFTQIEDL